VTHPQSQILLIADKLILDHQTQSITAQGHVQIEYNGNQLYTNHITYNKKTKRIIASGNIEIIDAKGIKIYAKEIDLTETLGEGFIKSLYAETQNHTHFAAEILERTQDGYTLHNGIYTACSSCQKAFKDVLWKIKAKKIIWNDTKKTIRFENSKFEILNIPIIWVPIFEIANPEIKRKSGFLVPGIEYHSELGVSLTNSYFWNIAPNSDLTLSSRIFSKTKDILAQALWRHRLNNGNYNLRFAFLNEENKNSLKNSSINRYMIASQGQLSINPYWFYHWNLIAQSDDNFSKDYNIQNYNQSLQRTEIKMTGLANKNYFDMQFYHFIKQDSSNNYYNQPWIVPRIDYRLSPNQSLLGGEILFTANLETIYRQKSYKNSIPFIASKLSDISGIHSRLTGELEWKRTFLTHYGMILSPIFALRSDVLTKQNLHDNVIRNMTTAGLEIRYPFLFTTENTTSLFEPIAQIFLRNNEKNPGEVINEDAQSFVFDTTNLFSRDKFSGYDRVEGGVRANIGLRSSSNINNNWYLYGLAGQSYQVAGINSFSAANISNGTPPSGLENKFSDYVAMISANNSGFFLTTRGRFSKQDLSVQRGEIDLQKEWDPLLLDLQYTYINQQSEYGSALDIQEIKTTSSYQFNQQWKITADTTYDIISASLIQISSGVSYQNECFKMIFSYLQTRTPGENFISHQWNFLLSLRTIGSFGHDLHDQFI
jgi:LPS-assembly protein